MFKSILGDYGHLSYPDDGGFPDFIYDLKLDSVLAPIFRTDSSGTLRRIYLSPLEDESIIRSRQDVFCDLEDSGLLDFLDSFSRSFMELGSSIGSIRKYLEEKGISPRKRRIAGRLLHLAEDYIRWVKALDDELDGAALKSQNMIAFSDYVHGYVDSESFIGLASDSSNLRKCFSDFRYEVHIRKGTIQVFPSEGGESLTEKVRSLFGDLADEEEESYLKRLDDSPYSEDVEESIMELLERTYPEKFSKLDSFFDLHLDFADRKIMDFSLELRFYISWISEMKRIEASGLHFCLPDFSDHSFHADDFFSLSLAEDKGRDTVPSSFRLDGNERIIVVTGPNQGGKTTFARAFGEIHYLASLGLPVPGRSACLRIPDHIFTHFGREEDILSGEGRLEDDVRRLHGILETASDRSIILINEIFSSTTAEDAVELGLKMLEMIIDKGSIAVAVTFLDELAEAYPEVVSMVSLMSSLEPDARTYHLERGKPDGRAFALGMAARYSLDPETLSRRLQE